MLSNITADEYLDKYQALEYFFLQTNVQKTYKVTTRMWSCVIDAVRLIHGRSTMADEGTYKRPKFVEFKVKHDMSGHNEFRDTDDLYTMYTRAESQLSDKHKKVFRYLLDGYTLQEIGNSMGFSLSRACQLRAQLIAKLRGFR